MIPGRTMADGGWAKVASAFASGVTSRGLTFRPPTRDECLALAHDLPVPRRARGGLGPAAALAGLARKGVAHAVLDAGGALVGLATIRRCVSDPLVGWAVRRRYGGIGLDAGIAVALTGACLDSGARAVLCEAGTRNARALGILGALGYVTVIPGATATLATTHASFVPDPSGPLPAPDGPEVCAPIHPGDWVRGVPAPRDILGVPFASGRLRLRPALASDVGMLGGLAPFGILPGGDPEGVDAFLSAMLETTPVVLASRSVGMPEGAVTLGTSSTGEHEIGWAVVPASRGAGLATDMTGAVLRRLFDEGCPGVACSISPRNAASLRVAAKLGFEPMDTTPDGALAMEVTPATFVAPGRGTDAPLMA